MFKTLISCPFYPSSFRFFKNKMKYCRVLRIPVISPRIQFVSLLFPFASVIYSNSTRSFHSYSHSPCHLFPFVTVVTLIFPFVSVVTLLFPFAPVVYSQSSLLFHSYSHSFMSFIPSRPCRFILFPFAPVV